MKTPTDLEDRLRAHYADRTAHELVPMPAAEGLGAVRGSARFPIPRDRGWLRGPRLALVATATSVVVIAATIAVLVGGGPGGPEIATVEPAAVLPGPSGPPGWSPVEPGAPDPFANVDFIGLTMMTQWGDRFAVLGIERDGAGDGTSRVWVTDDGVSWRVGPVDPPARCYQGITARGDQLIVSCKVEVDDGDGGSRVAVASTTDLEHWTMHPVGEPGSIFEFGLLAVADDGTVATAVLETDDPNTTKGATITAWSSPDLESWEPVGQDDPDGVLVDGSPTVLRWVDDQLVVGGIVNEWGDDGSATQRPAVWVWSPGSSWRRTILGVDPGAVLDLSPVPNGYVAVGDAHAAGAPSIEPAAWLSPDLVVWERLTIPGEPEAASEMMSGLFELVQRPDGTIGAIGGRFTEEGLEPLAWESPDGRTWTLSDTAGPRFVTSWGGRPVGFSAFPTRFWVWSAG